MSKATICGIDIDNVSLSETLNLIFACLDKRKPAYIVTPNVDHIVKLQKDRGFRKVYNDALLALPDGMPILWAAKFLGTPLKEKISGSDLFPTLCAISADKGYKLFFLGGREGAAEKAAEVLRDKYPKIQIVGTYCPSFGFERNSLENAKIIKMIKDAATDILFVGLGAPKQEKWIFQFKDQYEAPLSLGIGVSFEFIAGLVKRAPLWMQQLGFEWLWRLLMEPGRLWKRYLIDDLKFFWLVLKCKLNNNPSTNK